MTTTGAKFSVAYTASQNIGARAPKENHTTIAEEKQTFGFVCLSLVVFTLSYHCAHYLTFYFAARQG
jgi:hypothetical protein